MYDKERVENAIIPELFIRNIEFCVKKAPWQARHYKDYLAGLKRVKKEYLGKSPSKELRRELRRAVENIEAYWALNGINTTVVNMILNTLVFNLEDEGKLKLRNGKFIRLIKNMDHELNKGWDFEGEKLMKYGCDCNKAIEHWENTKVITQQQGYF